MFVLYGLIVAPSILLDGNSIWTLDLIITDSPSPSHCFFSLISKIDSLEVVGRHFILNAICLLSTDLLLIRNWEWSVDQKRRSNIYTVALIFVSFWYISRSLWIEWLLVVHIIYILIDNNLIKHDWIYIIS